MELTSVTTRVDLEDFKGEKHETRATHNHVHTLTGLPHGYNSVGAKPSLPEAECEHRLQRLQLRRKPEGGRLRNCDLYYIYAERGCSFPGPMLYQEWQPG